MTAPRAVADGDRGARGVVGVAGAAAAEAKACRLGDLVSSGREPEPDGGLRLLADRALDAPLLRLLGTWEALARGLDGTSGPLVCC